MSQPFVSVIMPVRNEEGFIDRSLQAVLSQDYPAELMEVIVADGQSTDGTREKVNTLAQQHQNLRLIENLGKIVSTGLNAGLAEARGEVIVVVGGHCEVAPDFVSQAVAVLEEHPEAWSVGGPIVHVGHGTMGRAIALAMSHPLAVGNAYHRFAHYEGYAEGAGFPVFRRWIFSKVGMFNEKLLRNQDDEFNYRLNHAGGKIFITPRIRYQYFVRDRLRHLFRQYFQYAFWRLPVIRMHGKPTTARQVVPLLFFLTVFCLWIYGFFEGKLAISWALPFGYVVALLTVGLMALRRTPFKVAVLMMAAIAIMHLAYASGSAYGIFAAVFSPGIWEKELKKARLSR